MKRDDLQKCVLCDNGVMRGNQLTFSRVTIERLVVDVRAVQRRDGLENVFGGGSVGARLAGVMGTDEDLAKSLGKKEFLVCDRCGSLDEVSILELNEREPRKA